MPLDIQFRFIIYKHNLEDGDEFADCHVDNNKDKFKTELDEILVNKFAADMLWDVEEKVFPY